VASDPEFALHGRHLRPPRRHPQTKKQRVGTSHQLSASPCLHQSRDKGRFIFRLSGKSEAAPGVDLKVLHAKIGELALENDFLEGALIKAGMLSAKR
jgi:transposase